MRQYTAQEMRETADGLKDDPGMDALIIADMLRQAADMMERERKYEYAWSYGLDGIKNNIGLPKEWIERIVKWDPECKMFRRVVSEWEVIGDGQN